MAQKISFNDLPEAVSLINEKLDSLQRMLAQRIGPEQSTPQDKLLSVKETACFLRLTVPTVYSKVSRGELPAMKQGNRLYFSMPELAKYLQSGKKKSNAEVQAEAEMYLRNRKEVHRA